MNADEFYLDGGEDYAGDEVGGEPTLEDLTPEERDELAERVGDESFEAMEQQWAAEDAARLQRERDEGIAEMANAYASQRIGQLTRVEQGGADDIHLPALHDTTAQLLSSREWLVAHGMPLEVKSEEFPAYVQSRGEGLIASALRDAVTALSPAQNENEALERYLLGKGG